MIFAIPLLENVTDVLFNSVGNLNIMSLIIVCFFIFGLLIVGVDFRFALMLVLPLIMVFSDSGWLPKWVGGLLWILIVTFVGYFLWIYVKERI